VTPGRPVHGEKRKERDEEDAVTQADTHSIYVAAATTKINKRRRKNMAWDQACCLRDQMKREI